MCSTNRFSLGGHSDCVLGDSFAGLSYIVGGDVLPIVGSVFIAGGWICAVDMFWWSFIYGGWRLWFFYFWGYFP